MWDRELSAEGYNTLKETLIINWTHTMKTLRPAYITKWTVYRVPAIDRCILVAHAKIQYSKSH